MFYFKTDFDFSPEAKTFIKDQYNDFFQKNFYHDLDLSVDFTDTIVLKELKTFLAGYHLEVHARDVGAFLSNTEDFYLGNPHIDIDSTLGSLAPVRSRFNCLIEGLSSDNMVWWSNIIINNPLLRKQQFFALNGLKYQSLGVKGADILERWQNLGKYDNLANNILNPSAFVKTSCVHCVSVSSGPRIVITVKLHKGLEYIL